MNNRLSAASPNPPLAAAQKPSRGVASQGRMSQGRMSQGRMSQGRMSQGRMSQGRMSQGVGAATLRH